MFHRLGPSVDAVRGRHHALDLALVGDRADDLVAIPDADRKLLTVRGLLLRTPVLPLATDRLLVVPEIGLARGGLVDLMGGSARHCRDGDRARRALIADAGAGSGDLAVDPEVEAARRCVQLLDDGDRRLASPRLAGSSGCGDRLRPERPADRVDALNDLHLDSVGMVARQEDRALAAVGRLGREAVPGGAWGEVHGVAATVSCSRNGPSAFRHRTARRTAP